MPPPTGFRVLGIDPGLNITGYGVIEAGPHGPRVLEAGVIRPVEGRAKIELEERLARLHAGIAEVFDQFTPAAVAVEQLYAHYEHPRTAIIMAHARGVLLLAAGQRGVPVTSLNATLIKKAITGHGHATKPQMQLAVAQELRLAAVPEPPDVADALAAALAHYHAQRRAG